VIEKKVFDSAEPKSYEYVVRKEDVGHILRLTIIASNESGKNVVSEISQVTPIVKEGEREKTFLDIRPSGTKEVEEFAKYKSYVIKEVCTENKKVICSEKEKKEEYELSPSKWYEVNLEDKPGKGEKGEEKERRMVAKPEA
jgi:hypothetical protein